MNKKTAGSVFKNLVAAFRDMDRADLLAGVRASIGYEGDPASWQIEVEDAIEPLEQMAWHGDEKAFNSLLYLGSKIACILESFAQFSSPENLEKFEKPFSLLINNRNDDGGTASAVDIEDLEALTSLSHKKLQETIELLEGNFPDVMSTFFPECLLKISRNASTGFPVNFNSPVKPPESDSLMQLMGKLAAVRARSECIQMVRKAIAQADVWPVALPSISEHRALRLKHFETLSIGSDLSFSVNPPEGRGAALGFAREGGTAFAYPIYMDLERERTYPRNPVYLESIRQSYTRHRKMLANQRAATTPKKAKISIENSELQQWNNLNSWRAEAALLMPLSDEPSVIEAWTEAGVKLIESKHNHFYQLESLPEFLRKKATDSTGQPSAKRIKTVVRDALNKGLKSIAGRIIPPDKQKD
jgi:hypothetical protein